jgi:hypothetical protein
VRELSLSVVILILAKNLLTRNKILHFVQDANIGEIYQKNLFRINSPGRKGKNKGTALP